MIEAVRRPKSLSPRAALVGLAALVSAFTLYANASLWIDDPEALRFFPPFVAGFDGNANGHLGAEYMNIARALAAGRGFADPFFVATGPTAWMPPAYPLLLAALLRSTESEPAIVVVVLVAKGAVLVWTGVLIYGAARRSARRLRPELALLAYVAWITIHFDWFFQFTHDVWILLFLVDAVLSGAWLLLERGAGHSASLAWGALGGLTLLTSPAIGAAWGATALFVGWRLRAGRATAASLALAALVTTPWIARNHVIFGEWILVKSNLAYDLYQASYISRDGIYDEPFLLRHPVWTTMLRPDSLYRTEGEAAFLAAYREKLRAAFREDPGAVARGAARRALAATLVYRPYRPRTEGRQPPLRTALHPLPFLGLLALLIAARGRPPDRIVVAIAIYVVALAPYILVAFYLRYLLPLSPALVLFTFWGGDALASRGASLADRHGPQ